MPPYTICGPTEPIFWFGKRSGSTSLLHAISNGLACIDILPSSLLSSFVINAIPLPPDQRARLCYDFKAFEAVHTSAAQVGDSALGELKTGEGEHYGYYFITFVKGDDRRLWELNGGVEGPVDLGGLGEGEDALSERAMNLGGRTFWGEDVLGDEVGFSLVALAPEEV